MPRRREPRVTMADPRSQCGKFGDEYRADSADYRARPVTVRQPVLPSQSRVWRQ